MLAAATVDSPAADRDSLCLHCGERCADGPIVTAAGTFCCHGCENVFAILTAQGLDAFYACDAAPGVSQKAAARRDRARFAVLDDPEVASRLVHVNDGRLARVTFSIPDIHCGSCVWLLERLWRFDPAITRSEVDLVRRTVRVAFRPEATSLRRIAEQLAALGYEPAITGEDRHDAPSPSSRRLYLQLGVAGFAFGNMMLFSIPRYANGAPLEDGFQRLFDALNLLFALPVLLFSAADFFLNAWRALRARAMSLDVPIALGLLALFGRSVADIATARGEGFLDSLAGLVFFLLIGRLFQQKVFARVAFERTFRSFLPLSVQAERDGGLAVVPIDQLRAGDRMVVRPQEVVPADATLLDAAGQVDYAFVTGEATAVSVDAGGIVRAGGRVLGRSLRMQVLREVSHSQLAAFWSNQVFKQPKGHWQTDVAARFSAWFTIGAIALAVAGAAAWWPDTAASASVATAVLIIACPCALTISAPLTLGTAMGLLGGRGLYLKHPAVALDLSRIDAVAFDKTGTLTSAGGQLAIEHSGLSDRALGMVRALAAESVHPTSRALAAGLDVKTDGVEGRGGRARFVREVLGYGVSGTVGGERTAIGTRLYVEHEAGAGLDGPADATFAAAGTERGWIRVRAAARPGIEQAAEALGKAHDLSLISGDHGGERPRWQPVFGDRMRFRQSPEDKLAYVKAAQAQGRHVLMVGDGLNDAGALAAADVGMAVSDETACMAPACDAVISGDRLAALPAFLRFARRARHVVVACFIVSVIYNVLGLSLAMAGALTPLAAAILMPVSSLTIVAISSGAMRWSARRMLPA